MTAPNANVLIQFLARNATEREMAAVEQDLTDVTAAADEASVSFTELARQFEAPPTTANALSRISDDVATATADFKAGIISVQDYEVALAHARNEAIALRRTTGQLSGQELSQFTTIVDQTTPKQERAATGTRAWSRALVSLGVQASGASGAVGAVARTGLQLAAGGAIAAAIGVGMAGIISLYGLWQREAREAKKAHEELYADIQQAADAIIPEAIKRERQRQQLEQEGVTIAQRLQEAQAKLTLARQQFVRGEENGAARVARAQATVEQLQQQEVDRIVKLHQLRQITAHEQQQLFERRREELELEVALVGKTEDQQRLLRLEHEKFTASQIVELERWRQIRIERERAFRAGGLLTVTPGVVSTLPAVTAAETRLRLPTPKELEPVAPVPLPEGGELDPDSFGEGFVTEVFDGIREAEHELEHFGATVGGVIAQGLQLQDAFLSAFLAVREGSKGMGQAFGEAVQRGVAQAAAAKGAFYLQEAVAALGMGLLGDPKGFAAAAKFFAASAGMFALAHVAAGGVSIGGGAGGGAGGDLGREARTADQERGEFRVILKGSAAVLAKDPGFVASVAEAFTQATDQRIIVEVED